MELSITIELRILLKKETLYKYKTFKRIFIIYLTRFDSSFISLRSYNLTIYSFVSFEQINLKTTKT